MPKIPFSIAKNKFDENPPTQSSKIKIPIGIIGFTRKIKSQIAWSKRSKWSKNDRKAFFFLVYQCFISLNLVITLTLTLDFLDFFQTFFSDFRPKQHSWIDRPRLFRPTQTVLDQNWSKKQTSITSYLSIN